MAVDLWADEPDPDDEPFEVPVVRLYHVEYNEGSSDHAAGRTVGENPYGLRTAEGRAWLRGWTSADIAARPYGEVAENADRLTAEARAAGTLGPDQRVVSGSGGSFIRLTGGSLISGTTTLRMWRLDPQPTQPAARSAEIDDLKAPRGGIRYITCQPTQPAWTAAFDNLNRSGREQWYGTQGSPRGASRPVPEWNEAATF
jgi:hypothetical protein